MLSGSQPTATSRAQAQTRSIMKIRNNNPLDLEGNNGEQISVTVTANGTVFGVTRDLNGQTAPLQQPFSFILSNSKNPTILVLFFVFSNNGGGVYNITTSGSAGGDTAHYSVAQFSNEAANAIAYTFDIV
jgi:hypothetical protein